MYIETILSYGSLVSLSQIKRVLTRTLPSYQTTVSKLTNVSLDDHQYQAWLMGCVVQVLFYGLITELTLI